MGRRGDGRGRRGRRVCHGPTSSSRIRRHRSDHECLELIEHADAMMIRGVVVVWGGGGGGQMEGEGRGKKERERIRERTRDTRNEPTSIKNLTEMSAVLTALSLAGTAGDIGHKRGSLSFGACLASRHPLAYPTAGRSGRRGVGRGQSESEARQIRKQQKG